MSRSHALRQAEVGMAVAGIFRKIGVSEATFYAWKKKFGSMGTAEIRELREDNGRRKRVVADLTLDKAMLQDVITKNGSADAPALCVAICQESLQRLMCDAHAAVLNICRATILYRSVKVDDPALRARIKEIATARLRYGYPRVFRCSCVAKDGR